MWSACRQLGGAPRRIAALPVAYAAAPKLPVPPHCGSGTGALRTLLARGLSDTSGSADPIQSRRLWRWGATSVGVISQQEVAESSKEPALVEDFRGVSIAACGSNHSGFVVDGKLYTYGSNKYNQLGRDVPEASAGSSTTGAEPALVDLAAEDGHCPAVTHVALGGFHSAAVTENGLLWTWGWGGSFWYGAGALGHGSRQTAVKPTLVRSFAEAGEEVKQAACGSQHTIVLTNEGRLYSTGKGDFGRLGRGETRDATGFEEIEYFFQSNDSVLSPEQPTTIVKVGAGNNFSAAMSQQGELWVWGRNDYGQLGLGEEAVGDMYSAERFPRLVRSLPLEGHRVVDFDCGEYHLVALTSAGALYEWGNRMWLEPHPLTLPSRYEDGIKDIVKVAAGEKFSCALTADGRVYTWGSKASGCLALGEESAKNIVQPTLIPASTFGHQQIVDITASKSRCLAITLEDTYIA